MENRKLLNYLSARGRKLPTVCAIIVGFLTVWAWVLATYGDPTGIFGGGKWVTVFLIIIPFTFLGFQATGLIAIATGWDIGQNPVSRKLLAFVLSLILNTGVVWIGLSLLVWGIKLIRSKSRAWSGKIIGKK